MTKLVEKRKWVLKSYVGKEVFLVAPIVDTDSLISGFYLDTDKENLFAQMAPKDIETEDYKCVHGVLMPAEVLPIKDALPKGLSYYLLSVDSTGRDPEGTIASYDDIDTLMSDISDLVQDSTAIEDLYIIYGYDMELRVSVDEADIRPVLIKNAMNIAKTMVP